MIVRTGSASYEVVIGRGVLGQAGERAREEAQGGKAALVTDDGVPAAFRDEALSSLEAAGLKAAVHVVPAGETSKSWEQAGRLLESFAGEGLGRDDVVIGLGGGVVGDLAGFCAATYMRGVRVAHVPTTLLAQVDSSIGGKTAVDLRSGKNLAGAFWQPAFVLSDLATLETLPQREWTSGLAEVAKSAVLAGEEALDSTERDSEALLARAGDAVERAVVMAAGLKASVVSADEREAAERESLNLGHTLGHAVEKVAGYGRVAHGVAVAEGMRFAARLAERVLSTDPAWSDRQDDLLDALALPMTARQWDAGELLAAMRSDKKARAGQVRFVMTTGPGAWEASVVDARVLGEELERWLSKGA